MSIKNVLRPTNLGNEFDLGGIEADKAHLKLDGITISRNTLTGVISATGQASKVVIDNTIADSSLVTLAGRYIVPTTGLSGAFVGQANKYADWNGVTWTFSNPNVNDKVIITTGTNAGNVFQWDGTVWQLFSPPTGMKTMSANVVGVAPNGATQPNNGMVELPQLDIAVPSGMTLFATYLLSYNMPAVGWGLSLNLVNYIAGSPLSGKTTWQNAVGGSAGNAWFIFAHNPATPNFRRGVFDNTVAQTTNNVIQSNIVWKNTSASPVVWKISFGADVNVTNAAAIPRMNIGSSVIWQMI
jgi:hypothetical protein